MADNITVLDASAASKIVSTKELSTGTVHLQRFQPALHDGAVAIDISDTRPMPVKEGDVLTFRRITTASTNAVNIKSSAGVLGSVHISNFTDTAIYVKFHQSSGVPTAGTGVVFVVGCQAGLQRDVYIGRAFTSGIAMTIVSGHLDTDNSNAVAGAVVEVGYV